MRIDERTYINQLTLPMEIISADMHLLNIPMPPSSNNIYNTFQRRGVFRRVKAPNYLAWERAFADWSLCNLSSIASLRGFVKQMKPHDVIRIFTEFRFLKKSIITLKNVPKKNDTSNRLKVLHDAIAKALHIDDSYFWDGAFTKRILKDEYLPEVCNVKIEIISLESLDALDRSK